MEYPPIENLTHAECKDILAKLSKGIAHPARVEIINILANKPPEDRCICGDIVSALSLAQSSVSQHLKVLKKTGWIQGTIAGPCVCYCLIEGIFEYYSALIHKSLQTGIQSSGKAQSKKTDSHENSHSCCQYDNQANKKKDKEQVHV